MKTGTPSGPVLKIPKGYRLIGKKHLKAGDMWVTQVHPGVVHLVQDNSAHRGSIRPVVGFDGTQVENWPELL